MNIFHNILYVGSSVDTGAEGLKQALCLARNNEAPLTVLVMAPDFPSELSDYRTKFEKVLSEQAAEEVESVGKDLGIPADGMDVEVKLMAKKHSSVRIIQEVLRNGHDLLVKESEPQERNTGFKAIDMALLRKCPCPVWLCRPIERPREGIKVAVAIDPSDDEPESLDLSLRMLRLSRSLADSCDGDLRIISCWDFEYEDYMRSTHWLRIEETEISRIVSGTQNKNRTALNHIVAKSGISGSQTVMHLRGRPETLIPETVEDSDIDIVVVGTLARSGLAGFIIGNTVENILQELDCSVLALKPRGFVSPVDAY